MSKCVYCGKQTETTGLLCNTCVENAKNSAFSASVAERKGVEAQELPLDKEDVRGYNIGESDYSKHKIQPWDLWIEYKLNPFDADIVKRVLRHKKTDSRKMDYEKIIHICKERIRQIETGNDPWSEENVKD